MLPTKETLLLSASKSCIKLSEAVVKLESDT